MRDRSCRASRPASAARRTTRKSAWSTSASATSSRHWASPDPLAIHALGGGEALNEYHYVSGNLLQARDPLGLESPATANRNDDFPAAERALGKDEADRVWRSYEMAEVANFADREIA